MAAKVTKIHPERGDLPHVPDGVEATTWGVTLPAEITHLSPRRATELLLHVSWHRWHQYAELLESEYNASPGTAQTPAGVRALIGNRVASGKDGLFAQGEEIRALTRLEADERDRCAKLARQCHEMGITGDEW